MSKINVSIIKTIAELNAAYKIRRDVFMLEGGEPEDEQFDGNDLCATHLLASIEGVPVGTMRLRLISGKSGGTIMWERLSVIQNIRAKNPWVFRSLLNAAKDFTNLMGISQVIGIVENPKLMKLWFLYGFAKTGESPLLYRGHAYTPIHLNISNTVQNPNISLRYAVQALPDIFQERQNA